MRTRLREMSRGRRIALAFGAIAALTIAVAAIALTGGSDEEATGGGAADARPLPNAGERDRERDKKDSPGKNDSGDKPARKKGGSSQQDSQGRESPKEIRRAVREVPDAELSDFTRQAALNVLKSLGYPDATVSLRGDRKVVFVTISRRFACGTRPSDVGEIAKAVKEIVIFASKVRVSVAGGGAIGAYVRDNCPPLKPPEADGRVVYSRSGTGIRGSDELKIRSRRFTVSYENGGGSLEIFVSSGEKLLRPVIKTERRGVGKQTYKGPGTFRVTATGSGQWKVRVYDGT